MPRSTRHRISEPKLIVLALGACAVMVIGVIRLIVTGDPWIGVLTVLAMAVIGLAIAFDLRGVIADTGDESAPPRPEPPPGRTVLVCTGPMTAGEVLGAVGEGDAAGRSVMVVAPEGLGTGGLMVDERDYARALRAQLATVSALRSAGINAAGHVGDRNPEHAIVDALALFPARRVVVVARGDEIAVYRRHLDSDALSRRTGAEIVVREAVGR
jgi:hypothetical protein